MIVPSQQPDSNDRYRQAMRRLTARPSRKKVKFDRSEAVTSLHVPALCEGQTGHVYVIGFARYIKIGWSCGVRKRILEVQEGCPEGLAVYAILAGRPEDERALHARFKHLRLRGEWFRRDGDIRDWIKAACR